MSLKLTAISYFKKFSAIITQDPTYGVSTSTWHMGPHQCKSGPGRPVYLCKWYEGWAHNINDSFLCPQFLSLSNNSFVIIHTWNGITQCFAKCGVIWIVLCWYLLFLVCKKWCNCSNIRLTGVVWLESPITRLALYSSWNRVCRFIATVWCLISIGGLLIASLLSVKLSSLRRFTADTALNIPDMKAHYVVHL